MATAGTATSDYIQFLNNPQKQGVWSLTLQPDSGSAKALRKLLSVDVPIYRGFQLGKSDDDESLTVPATIIPRLFAWLRYLLPERQKEKCPQLVWTTGLIYRHRRGRPQHYFESYLRGLAEEPRKCSNDKRAALRKATKIFNNKFWSYSMQMVPEQPSALHLISEEQGTCFQVEEDVEGRVAVFALQEGICLSIKSLFESLPNLRFTSESRKVFSPEARLLSLYMPVLHGALPGRFLRDEPVLRTISQALAEVREGRFVHAIRAIGIGAEELIVEVYETYLHDKAPEVPLGNLLSDLNSRIQEVHGGTRRKTTHHSRNLKKTFGSILDNENKKTTPNTELCAVCEGLLQGLIPSIEQISASVSELEEMSTRPQKTIIFPTRVNRSLSDLVLLRNRVSHRVDRLGSAGTVTYLEASLALKSYIVLALWWQGERNEIDYRVEPKDAIKKAIERNRVEPED